MAEEEEVGFCPSCGEALVNYDKHEGGFCPICEEWWPADIVEERMDEEE